MFRKILRKCSSQEFIEMIKEEKRLEAVHHARKYFATAESDQMDDIQKVMALLGMSTSFMS